MVRYLNANDFAFFLELIDPQLPRRAPTRDRDRRDEDEPPRENETGRAQRAKICAPFPRPAHLFSLLYNEKNARGMRGIVWGVI